MDIRLVDALQGAAPTLLRQLVDAAPAGAVNLGLGQPVAPIPAPLRAAAALDPDAPYTANAGSAEARAAVARRYGRAEAEALMTVGAQQALMLALCGLLQVGDEVLVPDPGFPVYEKIARWAGAVAVRYPLRAALGFQPEPGEVRALLTARTRLMVINSPGNPTGVCWARDRLQAVLDALAARGIPYLSDEVYSDFAFGGQEAALPSSLAPQGGLTASSLSKSHALMGWRIGWLVGPAQALRGLVPLHQLQVTCAPLPAQRAAVAALSEEGLAASRALVEAVGTRRALALDLIAADARLRPLLGGEGAPCPCDGALYLFLPAGAVSDGDDLALCHRLLSHGVIVIPGRAFGPGGRGLIRLAFGVEPNDLQEGLRRMSAALAADP
jgi:aspartate/methionine/tyrosine aminotransferase